MNIFIEMFFLYAYILLLFLFKLPDVSNNNYLAHKFMIFFNLSIFFFATILIKKINNGCKIKPHELIQNTIMNSLICVIGYAIYVDLLYTNYSCNIFKINIDSNFKRNIVVTTIIVIFMLIVNIIKQTFDNGEKC